MIRVEFSLAVALYIILILCLFFVLWILIDRKRDSTGLFSSEKDFFWQCTTCTYVYVDSMHDTISKCPRCNSYNKKEETDR